MISLESFSELLEVLYSIPLRQERWGHFLDLLCRHTGSRSSFLICANSRAALSIQEQGGAAFDPKIIQAYAEKYAFDDPYRLPLVKAGRTGVVDCNELLPNEKMWESDMFRHLNEPQGVRYPGLLVSTISLRRLEVISFWRSPEEGPLSAEANQLLELLVPHVRSALDIRYALGAVEERAQGAQAMADASPTATFLLRADGTVAHANACAQALLSEGDGLRLDQQILMATVPAMRRPLRELLRDVAAAAMQRGAGGQARALLLERRGERGPLHLLASPLPQAGGGGTLLLATDQEQTADLSDGMMRAYYGFTPAETEIANGLLTGYSLEEIAALRRVTVSTVRYQMKSLLSKSGATRQADLVRRLLALPKMAVQ